MMTTNTQELEVPEVEKQEIEVLEGVERTRPGKVFIPRAEIYETSDALVIVADMPGVDESSVEITLEKNVLTLKGFVDVDPPANYSLAYAEYEAGDYERSFTLSDEIDRDKIEASLKNGVLHVWLAKAGPAKTRKISVKAA
jgi:HSP20 family molecular chaperone IbpA